MQGAFSVQCGCDVFGEKLNYDVRFPGQPTVIQLRDTARRLFGEVAAARRPAHAPAESARLSIRKLTVYSEAGRDWADLTSAAQLRPGCQVYLLQNPSRWHTEVPGRIPHAEPVPASASPPRELLSASPAAAAQSPQRQQPANPRDKASRVFDELDQQRQGALSESAFVQGLLQTFYVRIDEARARWVFRRTDLDGDAVVTRADFERFAVEYPALLDALYFRVCDKDADQQQRREIRSCRESVSQCERGVSMARGALSRAEAEAADGLRALQQSEESVAQCRRRGQAQREKAAEAARAALEAESRLQNSAAHFARAQEEEDRARAGIEESLREQDIAERRLAQHRHELQQAAERLEEIRRELQEQQESVLRAQQAVGDSEAHAAAAQRRKADAAIRAQEQERLSAEARDAVSAAEQILAGRMHEQSEAERRIQEAMEEVERSEAKKQLDERAQQGLQDRIHQAQRLCDESETRLEEQRRVLRQRDDENQMLRQRRQEAWAEEEELIDQEVRLREQRDALERNEAQLRNRHSDFSRTMATEAPGSFSPSLPRVR
eukprot:TRINITY_DN5539_c0_g1_i1.p1 TRINITY_DN5539_c0_g1~~TRINITY_DN5539_c0_g1_i1.p1  ORF type:complete len:592 (+),score=162.60 TRINITY_DN5539_c0_g1_i1:120-1778(+)